MNQTHFSIATFNLYNLNLPGLAIYTDRDGWSQTEYDAKIAWTAEMLRRLDADVIGLQELWHRDAIEAALIAAGLDSTYEVLATPAVGTRIICAALVRKDLLVAGSAEWIQAFPPKLILRSTQEDHQTPDIEVAIRGFARPVLHFRIALRDSSPDTEVFVCHLKSKAPAPVYREDWFKADSDFYRRHSTALGSAMSTIRRTAEATGLRMMLTEVMKGTVTPVIVLGDLNDGQHSNTLNITTEQPRYLVGESTGGSDVALYTAQTLQEYRDTRDVYYTHVHEDMRESLDHVLVSEQFYDHSRRRIWLFDGLSITNDHLDDEDHKATGTSDHGVVKVGFRYRPA
ncbi:MAG: endonuclease/exonuclease/phosphatase family protein [Microlunatus sp.]|nr:endonuclease/exonuclease/phosphatase family protein [Microlunatus sp.]MDN5769267.1 endonuclease/exonuclease/phosphatase family protein [Microlunatus sp.]MDN5805263.1 endonuclease/exonuclease/phosphatase family protein [Microlunatus sp.]